MFSKGKRLKRGSLGMLALAMAMAMDMAMAMAMALADGSSPGYGV